jgi:uncharacterized membrane protein (DUF373 family)
MLKIVETVERYIIRALTILMLLAITFGTIELGRVLILEIIEPPAFVLDISKLFEGFGLVLVILIGVELLKVMKMFLTEDKIKPEMVVEVAVIALCNKIITLDTKHTTGDVLLGLAALLIGLSFGYFVLRFRTVNKEIYQKLPVEEKSNSES